MGKLARGFLAILFIMLVSVVSFLFGSMTATTGMSNGEQFFTKLKEIRGIIDNRYLYEFEEKDLTEGMYKGYVAALNDPYTQYYTFEEYKAMNEETEGAFGGVGIEVSAMNGQFIEVVAPIKDTPAERAGVKSGDRIFMINDKEYSADMMQDAVSVMRGEPGTPVKLTILRSVNGKDEQIVFDIVREIINVQSIHSEMLEDDIGYLRITNFQANTATQFMEAWEDLIAKGAKGIVLDLRNNPGGLLDVTIKIGDFLLPEGDVMKYKYADGTMDSYKSDATMNNTPLVTLINSGSASASEVLSGALKDYDRSEIVGTTSFGKGVVQQIINLRDGSGVKVTMAEFFTPKDNKIHGVGISPTKEVELPDTVTTIGPEALDEDVQLQEAIKILK